MYRLTFTALLLVVLISSQAVLAHFQLTYPASRGFDENIEATAPCGGFNTLQTRTMVPLTNAFVEINSEHTSYTYTVSVLVNSNPAITDFSTANLTQVASGSRNYPLLSCLSMDLTKDASIVNGANATIQVTFNGGDGVLYQCTDVTFVDSAPAYNNSMCINDASTTATASASGSASSASTTASTSSSTSAASSINVAGGLMLLAALCVSLAII